MHGKRDWDLEYDGAAPPLPKKLERDPNNVRTVDETWTEAIERILPQGAYFIVFDANIARSKKARPPKVFAGVVRIVHETEKRPTRRKDRQEEVFLSHASGDLYSLPRTHAEKLVEWFPDQGLRPENLETLQFPIVDYRYYLSLQSLWLTNDSTLLLGFDTHRFDSKEQGWQRRQSIMFSFKDEDIQGCHYCGTALNSWKTDIGSVTLIRVADELRRATVEAHAAANIAKNDLVNKLNENMDERYRNATGWSIQFVESVGLESEPEEPKKEVPATLDDVLGELRRIATSMPGAAAENLGENQVRRRGAGQRVKVWTPYELRAYHRKNFSDSKGRFEEPWKYHFLLVEKIDIDGGNPRGLMYDSNTGNFRDAPRRGAAIAVGSSQDEEKPDSKKLLSTALHELGHMQGLYHNPTHPGLMQPSEYREKGFVPVEHAKTDAFRLRHLPDLWVRPGGVPFGYLYRGSAVEVLDLVPETDGLRLMMEPAEACAGEAPEIVLKLTNWSGRDILCPNERTAQLSNGRLGLILHTPSGRRQELSPVHYPRKLRGLGSTSLLLGETIELRIRWDRDQLPREAGLYHVEAHLLWIVDQNEEGDDTSPKDGDNLTSQNTENNETNEDTEVTSGLEVGPMPYRASTSEGILRVL